MTTPANNPTLALRHDLQAMEAVLDDLDAKPGQPAGREARRFARQRYRNLIHVEFQQTDKTWLRYAVYTRNVSRRGVGFLIALFVYPRTPCRVRLTDPRGRSHELTGYVARCRYLPGTASLHEVGVRFEQEFDLALLDGRNEDAPLRVLVADADAPALDRLRRLLEETGGAEVTTVTEGQAALEAAFAAPCDLIIVDLAIPDMDGLALIKTLRSQGYTRPIAALAESPGTVTRSACTQAGANACLAKPVTAEAISALLGETARPPLVTTRLDHPELAELIDTFVAGLRDKVRQLERAHNAGNVAIVSAMAHVLRAEGEAYGFDPIGAAAAELERAASEGAGEQLLRRALDELITACGAAQPVAARRSPG